MHDYMKALYHRFETPSEQMTTLEKAANKIHRQLANRLKKPEKKMLLRLVDLEAALRDQACLPEQFYIRLPLGPGYPAGTAGRPAALQLRGRR